MDIYPKTSKGDSYRYLWNLGVWELLFFLILLKRDTKIQETSPNLWKKLHLEQTTEYSINRDELANLKYNIRKKNYNVIHKGFKVW